MIACRLALHRLDVDHRGSVDHFDGADPQPVFLNLPYGYEMDPDRIRTVRRARCKHAGQWALWVRTRMNLQHVTAGAVQPSQQDQLVSARNPIESLCDRVIYFEPGVRSSFRALLRRLSPRLDRR